jgi:uncharacterized tellurite resistance protein B-like protein
MTHHDFKERGDALENLFFAHQDQKLINDFRKKRALAEKKEALTAASGIRNDEVLDALLDINVTAESLAAMSLYPMVAVAWADQKLEENEVRAILHAAEESGVTVDSEAHALIENWLERPPEAEVEAAWKSFAGALVANLSDSAKAALVEEVMGRARRVAQAAGGVLGLLAISAAEDAKLAKLEKAFD